MKTSFRWPLLFSLLGIALCSQKHESTPLSAIPGRDAAAVAMREKADQLAGIEQYDSAIVYAQSAAILAEKAKDWHTWGKAQTDILSAHYNLGQYAEAASAFPSIEAQAHAVISPDSAFWGDYYNAAGAIFNMQGNYEAALRYGLLEIAFDEKSGDTRNLAVACNNVGNYYRGKGDFDRAQEYVQSGLQVCLSDSTTSPDDLAWTYANLSKIWYRKKDFQQAVANAERGLAILEQRAPNNNALKIQLYLDLSNAYIEAKTYDKALDYLQKAVRIHAQYQVDEQIEITWHNLGYVYAMKGRYNEATVYLNKAIERYGPKHFSFGKACRHMGMVAQRQDDLRGALAWQQKALQALTDSFPAQDILANPAVQRVNSYLDFLFALRDKGETLHRLANKEQNQQLLEASLATYDVAMGLLDTMRAEYQEGSRQFWNREARPIVEGAIGAAMEMNRRTNDAKYLGQAFRYAEKSKALLLAEALRESAAKQKAGIPEALLQKEKDLKIDIAFYKRQIFREQHKTAPDSSKILLWQKEMLDRHRAYESLLSDLEHLYPAYYQIKYSQPPLSIEAVQRTLPPNCGLLEYFSGDSFTYAFYLDRNSASGLSLQTEAGFGSRLENFINNLRNRDQVMEQGRNRDAIAAYASDAAGIYKNLVARVISKVPDQLIIIPDGNLSYLPFELLLTHDADKTDNYAGLPYLLQKTAVRYEYSASLALLPPAGKKPKSQFIGYAPGYTKGGPVTERGEQNTCRELDASDFAELGNNQAEVSQITGLLGGQALLGDKATEAHFKQHAAEARILHFAMHGFLNDCDPLYSGLVFCRPDEMVAGGQDPALQGEDGFLHAYEIYNLSLNADLAVLSACNTGRGQLAKGEGVISLARAFKYAGCSNVMMSLWQADDQATAQIMQGFYQYLKEGKGKDASIRQAKLDYLNAANRNHPFFWGAFVLVGDDRPIEQPSNRIVYGIGALLLAGIALAFWRIKKGKKPHSH